MLLRITPILLCCLLLVSLASAQDLVINGGFEEPADGPPTAFRPWDRWQSSAQTAYRVTDQKTQGTWALLVRMELGSGTPVVRQRLKDYQPGQLYEIVFQARSTEPYDSFTVDLLDEAADAKQRALASMAYTNLDWTRYSLRFSAPDQAGHPLYLRFYPRGPKLDSAVYVDDVRVLPVSDTAVEFTLAYEQIELDTFNAITQVAFDLSRQLEAARWRLHDLAEYQAAAPAKLAPLRQQAEELHADVQTRIEQLEELRQRNLFSDIVLSALPDDEIAKRADQLHKMVTDLDAAINRASADLQPRIAALREQIDAAAPGWQPPAQRTATYSPAMLSDRFHRIITYHGYMPASEYLHRSLWELQPTAIESYASHTEARRANRAEFLRLNSRRTMPYIAGTRVDGWLFDLSATKEGIDATLADIGDDPAFSGFEIDEPSISDQAVATPAAYAEFRNWLASRYPDEVGGFAIAEALTWERPETIATDFDKVMWMEQQQFKAYWFAHRLKQVQDYIHSKNPDAVLLVCIQQYLPMEPQRCSYVTTSAALNWIAVDPYNSANVGEALLMDLLRSNSKGPNLLVVGTCYDRTSGRFAKDMAISFAHCGGVWNWCWVYMSKHRAPVGVTTGAWPLKYRGRWKEGMYEAAQDVMGKMAAIEPYLVHTETAANVGLVYSERTGIYGSLPDVPQCYISNLGVYQALQQLQIPCEALFAESMTPEKLSKFASLILVDAELLTDDEVTLLKNWCRAGGSLIALGGIGTRDRWGREHENYGGLTELFGVKRGQAKTGAATWQLEDGAEVKLRDNSDYDVVALTAETARAIGRFDNGDIAAVTNSFGNGQVVLLPAHSLGLSFDGSTYRRGMYKIYWPGFKANLRKLVLDAVREAGGRLPVRAENAPENVEVGLRKQGERLIVHLLNYDDAGPVSGMALLADGRADQRAFYPASGEEIATTKRGRDLHIPVRDFEHHCCLVIEPR